jgi:UDP-glucuronate decarboxylase
MLELAELVIGIVGGRPSSASSPCRRTIRGNDSRTSRLAGKSLDWEPKVSLEDGLKETIAYFRRVAGAP